MIIPVHHIIVANLPVVATTTFEQGYALALDTDGYAVLADGDHATTTRRWVIGLAADQNRAATSLEYQNRVSDMGNETGGSGQVSVYTGGFFYVDVDDASNLTTPDGTVVRGVVVSGSTTVPGTPLYASDSQPGRLSSTTSTSGQVVAYVIEAANEIQSGIPGEFEPGSSLVLVDDTAPRQFVKIKLAV